jgi:phthalate 4,5-dioxygenase oxygenase subunit
MWLTMGPIADRTNDRLGASDMAIVEFRKQMLEAVRAVQGGATAIGTGENAIPKSVCAYQAVVPKTTDWRAYETSYVWPGDGVDRSQYESSYNVKA